MKRDHEAEWKAWTSWLEYVGKRVASVPSVTTSITQPKGLSNRMPSLHVLWDREKVGLTGDAVVKALYDGEPRVAVFPARAETGPGQTGVTVNPYMMSAGDEKIVADRLYAELTGPRPEGKTLASATEKAPLKAPAADLSGQWDVKVEYAAGTSTHGLSLRQRGNEVDGAHRGDFLTRDVTGTIDGDAVRLRSAIGEQSGDAVSYTFTGTVSGDEMSGTLDLGEYLGAKWTAHRRAARRG
jgi:L-seryl-tRNA(Ser) seleniumtransferase